MNNQNLNLLLAFVLSIGIIIGWQHFFEKPRLAQNIASQKQYAKVIIEVKNSQISENILEDRLSALKKNDRISFENEFLKGSINKNGLRIDDLTFLKYKESVHKNSGNVELLNPASAEGAYFAELGWISSTSKVTMPKSDTLWNCNKDFISKGEKVRCSWVSPENIEFINYLSLDDKYMFTIESEVKNNSNSAISVQSYGIIYKTYDHEHNRMSIVHEGVAGVIGDELKEFNYKDIKDKKKISNKMLPINWLGITDKYWLVAFIPDGGLNYSSNINFIIKNQLDRYQTDFVSGSTIIEPCSEFKVTHSLFGGAKELEILDDYEQKLNIKLFDRTVDFGWFYILTRPLLWLLHHLYGIVGNFGISIMLVTVIVKASMFSLANKSYRSMKVMKELHPQIEKIKERCGDDKVRFNQEIMNLYKQHKVNPLSGCLPLIIQIPVFFSLYKVLNVSIDMRHAEFFGWINDLSVADPTNLFNLFGLLPWNPPAFLHLGAWPILMATTMYLQQRMSPPVSDPVQAQVMKMMPLIFLFMFASFPSGLLIYWTWNNILSIAQQSYINYSYAKSK